MFSKSQRQSKLCFLSFSSFRFLFFKNRNHLTTCDDIVITKSEKGDAVVKIDVKNYIREVETQLKDKDN